MRSTLLKLFPALMVLSFLISGCNSMVSGTDPSSGTNGEASTVTESPSQKNTPGTLDPAKPETPASRVPKAQQIEYLDAINAARAETQDCGDYGIFDPAPELTWNVRLGNAADEHSKDMAQNDTLGHTGSGTPSDETAQAMHLSSGSRLRDRLHHHGYDQWHAIGENISGGDEEAQTAVDTWLKSPVHCANLMSPDFTEVGMMVTQKNGTQYGRYWTVDFGGK